MLLHSMPVLANLVLKETMPPQSRTSPHVTDLMTPSVSVRAFIGFAVRSAVLIELRIPQKVVQNILVSTFASFVCE